MNTMNRCLASLRGRLLLSSTLLMGLCGLPCDIAFAQGLVRPFPAAALRGTLQVTTPPDILINGKTERLAPGAHIRGSNNLLVLSASLAGQSVLVNYLRDPQGQIREVWILSAQEAQEKRAGMETRTNFIFGSDADKPKTDDGKTPFDQLPKFPQQ
jgi:hypothetical protein